MAVAADEGVDEGADEGAAAEEAAAAEAAVRLFACCTSFLKDFKDFFRALRTSRSDTWE